MSLSVDTIARYAIGTETSDAVLAIEVAQVEHRLNLLDSWNIPAGSRVLEIGCGQGTSTTVLASAVGPEGHVDAVDPGPPDYGAPYTLAQAQAHISSTAIGDRISWHNADPMDFLAQNPDKKWDFVVFAHCIWYFDNQDVLVKMLAALKGRATNLLICEYAMKATEKAALPHVLAAITRASLEAHNKDSEANIRCMLAPDEIKKAAKQSGWTLDVEDSVVPGPNLSDGHWETSDVKSTSFLEEINKFVSDQRVNAVLKASREAVLAAIAAVDGAKTRTMDVWVARFN